jgi:Immunity protein 27
MDKLKSDEFLLTGNWVKDQGHMRGDAVSERIEWLITHHLTKIASSPQSGGWETLYRDPRDGRYWERTYPRSEMHGGGPPELVCLAAGEAEKKYGITRI